MNEFIIVWGGSHKNADADLLCVYPAHVPDPAEAILLPPIRHNRRQERERVMALLADRESWPIKELRQKVGMPRIDLQIVLQVLKANGSIHSTAYGCVALNREK